MPMAALMGTTGAATRTEKERQTLEFIRFVGVLTIAAGIGLWFLLMLLGYWDQAVGVGGLMGILGVALIVTTLRALRVQRGE